MKEVIDILNRDEFVSRLISLVNLISNNKKNITFAIDGEWGSGKSFILDIFEEQVELLQKEETNDNRYLVFHYNCWEYDYYDEPLIAILSAMIDKTEKENSIFSTNIDNIMRGTWKKVKEKLEIVAEEFIKNKIGINVVEIIKDINSDIKYEQDQNNSFDSMFTFKKTLEKTREQLKGIAEDKTIIIVVDELDRCLPEYEIKVLERLHHLFNSINNIIVIIAIDSEQLKNTIKQIYGENVKVDKYLKKIINLTINLDKGVIANGFFTKYKDYLSRFENQTPENLEIIDNIVRNLFLNIDMRTQEKLIERAELIHSLISDTKTDISIMCYELIWMVTSNIFNTGYFEWIAKLNTSDHVVVSSRDPDMKMKKPLEDYLIKLERNIGSSILVNRKDIGQREYIKLYNGILPKVFWYFSASFCEIEFDTCGKYMYDDSNQISREINITQEFTKLARIII